MTKICTTIEQSERLVGLGLDPGTADMKYFFWKSEIVASKPPSLGYDKDMAEFYKTTDAVYIPAWSLSRLLDQMPLEIEEVTGSDGLDYGLQIDMRDRAPRYYSPGYEVYHPDFPYSFEGEDLTDNIVEAVCWLLQEKII